MYISCGRACTRCRHKSATGGFTLIELLVVVAVAVVLACLAAPPLTETMSVVKVSSASNNFVASLYRARSEAIKRNGRVVLCKSAEGVNCANSGGWEQGWIVFHDIDNDGLRDSSELLIMRELPLSSSLRLTGNQNVARYISFAPNGATRLLGGGFQAGTLTICNYSLVAGEGRHIVINAAGRPRVEKVTVSSCA